MDDNALQSASSCGTDYYVNLTYLYLHIWCLRSDFVTHNNDTPSSQQQGLGSDGNDTALGEFSDPEATKILYKEQP